MSGEQIVILTLVVLYVALVVVVGWLIKTIQKIRKDINHNFKVTQAKIYLLEKNSTYSYDFKHRMDDLINKKQV